jgi:hypothetical protein
MGPALLVAGLAPIIGGIVGNIASSGDRRRAQEAMNAAFREMQEYPHSPDEAFQKILSKLDDVGVLTPQLEQEITLAAPKVAEIQEAPELRKAQMTALELLGQRATTGMTTEDRARLAEIQLQQARETEAKRQQILQSYQQRGLGGAGSEIAAQLQAASAGSAQAAEQGLQLAAQAQRSALEAAREYGGLGGQIRGQEFDIARAKATAEDQTALERFRQATSRQERNIGAQRQYEQARRDEAFRRAQLGTQTQQQMFQNQAARVQALANARLGQATQSQQQAQQTAGIWSGIGSGIGQAGMYAGVYGKKPSGTAQQPNESQSQAEQPRSAYELQQEQDALNRFINSED